MTPTATQPRYVKPASPDHTAQLCNSIRAAKSSSVQGGMGGYAAGGPRRCSQERNPARHLDGEVDQQPRGAGDCGWQAVRKAGRPPGNVWSIDDVKKVEDWLIGLGPGRTEEIKLNVRSSPQRACLSHANPQFPKFSDKPDPRLSHCCFNCLRWIMREIFETPDHTPFITVPVASNLSTLSRWAVQANLKRRSVEDIKVIEDVLMQLINRACRLQRAQEKADHQDSAVLHSLLSTLHDA